MNAADIAAALGDAFCVSPRLALPLPGARRTEPHPLVTCWGGCNRLGVLAELRRSGLLDEVRSHNNYMPISASSKDSDRQITRAVAQRLHRHRPAQRMGPRQRLPLGIPSDWDSMSLDALWGVLNRPRRTPQTTIEAIMIAVHERGPAALRESANIERLQRCDDVAKAEINRRIASLLEVGVISS